MATKEDVSRHLQGRLAHEAVLFLGPSSEQFTPWKGLTQSNWRCGFTGKKLERTQTKM